MKDGLRCDSSVSIPRVLCTSCGHTHALIPDVLIPFGSYSLCFILSALQRYLNRSSTVAALCDSLQISISTLYGWIHLFEQHASLWLGILHKVAKLNSDASAPLGVSLKSQFLRPTVNGRIEFLLKLFEKLQCPSSR